MVGSLVEVLLKECKCETRLVARKISGDQLHKSGLAFSFKSLDLDNHSSFNKPPDPHPHVSLIQQRLLQNQKTIGLLAPRRAGYRAHRHVPLVIHDLLRCTREDAKLPVTSQ